MYLEFDRCLCINFGFANAKRSHWFRGKKKKKNTLVVLDAAGIEVDRAKSGNVNKKFNPTNTRNEVEVKCCLRRAGINRHRRIPPAMKQKSGVTLLL